MVRKYRLSTKHEDLTVDQISGRWFDYTTNKQQTLLLGDNEIKNRVPDESREEHHRVWRETLTMPEPSGRRTLLKDDKTHYHSYLVKYYEFEDDDKVVDKFKVSDPDKHKQMLFDRLIVKCLMNHNEVSFMGSDGVQKNKNYRADVGKFELKDMTSDTQNEVKNQIAANKLIAQVTPIFESDYEAFESICLGFELGPQIKEAGGSRDLVYLALTNAIKSNPKKFEEYLPKKDLRIIFERAVEKQVIQDSGTAYFYQGDVIGQTKAEVLEWIQSPSNKRHRENIEIAIGGIRVKSTGEGLVVEPKKVDPAEEIIAEVRKKVQYQSQYAQASRSLKNKYAGDQEALAIVESEIQKIVSEKGWEIETAIANTGSE